MPTKLMRNFNITKNPVAYYWPILRFNPKRQKIQAGILLPPYTSGSVPLYTAGSAPLCILLT